MILRLAVGQLRRRAGRTAAMLAGVLAATSGFVVLTSAAQTSQLRTTGAVDRNFRAAYDILVRPGQSRLALEEARGLVRPNFLSGQFGGITPRQYAEVGRVSGVEVAAPVAMVGYVTAWASPEIDLTDLVDRNAQRQLLKAVPTWHTDRGLSTLTDDMPVYAYVTRHPVAWPSANGYSTGTGDSIDRAELSVGQAPCGTDEPQPPLEVLPDGSTVPICGVEQYGGDAFSMAARSHLAVAHLRSDGTFVTGVENSGAQIRSSRLSSYVLWPMALLLAAVDPEQEARLVALDRAVVGGRYLAVDDVNYDLPETSPSLSTIPVLATTRPYLDELLSVAVQRIQGSTASVAGLKGEQLRKRLAAAAGEPVGTKSFTADEAYRQRVNDRLHAKTVRVIRSGAPSYEVLPDGALRPQPVSVDVQATWKSRYVLGLAAPWFARDRAYRPVTRLPDVDPAETAVDGLPAPAAAVAVGYFDPQRLSEFSALSAVPLETYQPARAMGADRQTRSVLGGAALEPNSNPGSYLATPPQMLTTLAALPRILGKDSPATKAPISAIRVRVSGVHGMDELSQERVRRVAEEISTRTGLDVDITIGSSPAPQAVVVEPGKYGRPQLRLSEGWSRKGVAVAIIEAVDRKSLLLFGLILLVCVLFLSNAVSAGVRDRRRELAVLVCLGWPSRRIAKLILAEVGLISVVAGLLSAAMSLPLAALLGIRVSAAHALAAVPVALALAMLAGTVPAIRASRVHPAAALHPAVSKPRGRGTRRLTIRALAFANTVRVPGRALLAAAALAVGIGAVTFLTAILRVFHNEVTGTLLGDAISLQARSVDLIAAASAAMLGTFAVADVVYLGIRERSAEFATLRATGWSERHLVRLVTYEGTMIGIVGGLGGAAIGIAAVIWLTGTPATGLISTAATVAGAGVVLATAAAAAASLSLRYLPTTALLAED